MRSAYSQTKLLVIALTWMLVTAGVAALPAVSHATPTIKTTCNGKGTGHVEVNYRFPPSVIQHTERYPATGNAAQPFCFEGVRFDGDNFDLDHIVFSGCCVNGVLSQYLFAYGNVMAKSPVTESHIRGGPVDSVAIVISSTPTSVTLGLPSDGRLRLRAGTTYSPKSKFTVVVYPDSITAILDPNVTGAGAALVGSVSLDQNGTLVTTGTFSNSDFVVTNLGGGTFMANPAPGLSKTAIVASSLLAEVVIASEGTNVDLVPGSTWIGLSILSVLLLAGAVLALRRRRVLLAR